MKEKLYKEKVSENKLLNYTTRSTKLNLSTEFLLYFLISYSLYYYFNKGMTMTFIEES
jgi:hypothetical protein